jgi:peptide-methionine (S)-S-oxide reductase
VWRTRVGYAGGAKESPTYEAIGDHVESIEVLYDPKVVSYDELLDVFWESHDPSGRPYTNQYSSIVLATTDAQLATARESARRYEVANGKSVATRIEPLSRFYPAEDYHQKYYLRQDPTLAREFSAMFGGDEQALRDSAAAAKVNGYIAGDGTPTQLAARIGSLGLAEKATAYLQERVSDAAATAGCAVELK